MDIYGKFIGRGHPVYVIAEIGNNHNGSVELARKSVIAAAQAGADAVKFQKRNVSEVFAKSLLDTPQTHSLSLGKTYGDYRRRLELSDDALAELKDVAHAHGMAFFVTPFDLKSAEALDRIGMDAWKIASFDLTHKDLLDYVASRGQTMFLSTGLSSMEEIDEAAEGVLGINPDLVLMHCVSIYPTPDEDLNLGAIATMIDRYSNVSIGYSGHEVGIVPTIVAASLGACAVERHFTIDKTLPGPDHSTVSLDPGEFAEMVRQIRRIERAVADKSVYIHEREVAVRRKHSKSIVARDMVPAGTVITASMLAFKSPGSGMKPTEAHRVIGRAAATDILADTPILPEHIK